MDIEFDVCESREVNVCPRDVRRKRRVDDYDYNDPFIEHFDGEDDAVEIEPHLQNFFIYEGQLHDKPSKVLLAHAKKKPSTKKDSSPLDSVYCMQNLVYSNVLNRTHTESDIVDLLVYDLIISHDTTFEKVRKKIDDPDVQNSLNVEFLSQRAAKLQADVDDLAAVLARILESDTVYNEGNIVYTDELCSTVFRCIDAKIKLEIYNAEVTNDRKSSYNTVRKSTYNWIYGMGRLGAGNWKQLGYYLYKHSKRYMIGRCNGFKAEYLCTERESDSKLAKTSDTLHSSEEPVSLTDASTKGNKKEKKNSGGASTGQETQRTQKKVKAVEDAQVPDRNVIGADIDLNNSCSLQKIDSQWLETLPEDADNDTDKKAL